MIICPNASLYNPGSRLHLLHGHLRHHIKSRKVSVGEVVFVLAHLNSIQPLVHGAEAGEVWDAAVQQREVNAEKDTKWSHNVNR